MLLDEPDKYNHKKNTFESLYCLYAVNPLIACTTESYQHTGLTSYSDMLIL